MIDPVHPGLLTRDPPSLIGSRCAACHELRFPATGLCSACQSTRVERVPLSTRGTVYTFTIVRNRPPGYAGEVPYAFGFVDLPDGIRVISTLAADDLSSLSIGDVVEFELFALETADGDVESYRYRRRPHRA